MPTELTQPVHFLAPYVEKFLRILVVLGLAFVLSRVISRLLVSTRTRVFKLMEEHSEGSALELQKRAATVGEILRKAVSVMIWTIAIAMSLREIGFDIGPIIAGAGIVGIAVGFGAQSLVKDVISGAFMLIENQIRVNDVANINGTGGLVEEINIRTTVLRGTDGTVHIFPNGSIQTLANLTRGFSYYVFDINVAYKEDTDRVVATMKEVADEMREEPQWAEIIREPLDVLGVDKLSESTVVIKARIKTRPSQQWAVGREMNRRFKKKFGAAGIDFPFRQLTVSFESGLPASFREELKQVIREVLAEAETVRKEKEQPDSSATTA